MTRRWLILFVGVTLVAFLISCAGRDVAEPPLVRDYVNHTYNYKISYPADYELDLTEAPEAVDIEPTQLSKLASVTIVILELSTKDYEGDAQGLVDMAADVFIESVARTWENPTILSNTSKPDYLRIVEYTYTFNGSEFKGLAYCQWRQTVVYIRYGSAIVAFFNEVQAILDSFEYIGEAYQGDTAESLLYRNSEYGYSIEYPRDWKIDTTRPKMVLIDTSPSKGEFAFITISVLTKGQLSLDEAVEFKKWYLLDVTADEWEDLKFIYSHSMPDKWDWVIGFTYIDRFDGVPAAGEVYILQTQYYTYFVQWDGTQSLVEICQQIVESFKLSGL